MEKPSKNNNVFNHSERDMAKSTGVTEEELSIVIDQLNQAITEMPEEKYAYPSNIIELLMSKLTKKQLAILFHCEQQRNGELERIVKTNDAMSMIMSRLDGESGQA